MPSPNTPSGPPLSPTKAYNAAGTEASAAAYSIGAGAGAKFYEASRLGASYNRYWEVVNISATEIRVIVGRIPASATDYEAVIAPGETFQSIFPADCIGLWNAGGSAIVNGTGYNVFYRK